MKKAYTSRHFVLFAATLLALLGGTACNAGDTGETPRILVTGEGVSALAPDMATVSLSVVREAETASAALEANSTAMGEVLAAMQAAGIAERDLQTTDFSVQPKYVYPRPVAGHEPEAPRIVGYTVRNGLAVRIRDISQVGLILDKSVALGVNEGGNIVFGNDDPSAAIEQARVMAVKNALAKAATLAEAAGVKTGRILQISEQSFNPRPQPMAEMAMLRAADAVPVAAGENSYRVTVNVTFEIEQ